MASQHGTKSPFKHRASLHGTPSTPTRSTLATRELCSSGAFAYLWQLSFSDKAHEWGGGGGGGGRDM